MLNKSSHGIAMTVLSAALSLRLFPALPTPLTTVAGMGAVGVGVSAPDWRPDWPWMPLWAGQAIIIPTPIPMLIPMPFRPRQ